MLESLQSNIRVWRPVRMLVVAPLLFVAIACGGEPVGPQPEGFCSTPAETTPAIQGIDQEGLAAAYDQISQLSELQALLVIRNELLVCQAYFRGRAPGAPLNVRSVSKSVLSALVGIAVDEGLIPDLDTPISSYFPEYYPDQVDDARKSQVTIRHLLEMQGGWAWTENGQTTADWLQSASWNVFALGLPLETDPGTNFNYTTAGTHLLATLLGRVVPGDLDDWATDRLLTPAGMTLSGWAQDPQGNFFGGSEMYFTPRDMGRFGELFLNGGARGGRQIVPSSWVAASTATRTSFDGALGYGYLWWTRPMSGRDVYLAWGFGGQLIVNVPSLDLVVVVVSSVVNPPGYVDNVLALIEQVLLPTVR